mmetsp:Transcript_13779/g.40278  ORF Transcript_13779/g.40278 Transcript_13779/m.40278 type:complete len:211 (+) Transcript_13779:1314-1946(+)
MHFRHALVCRAAPDHPASPVSSPAVLHAPSLREGRGGCRGGDPKNQRHVPADHAATGHVAAVGDSRTRRRRGGGGGGGAAAEDFRMRRQAQSVRLRQLCLPLLIGMLHEVYHDAGLWFLRAADQVNRMKKFWTMIPVSHIAFEDELHLAAANRFRSAIKVADMVASRRCMLYTVTSAHETRELLLAIQSSSDALLRVRPSLSLELEPEEA